MLFEIEELLERFVVGMHPIWGYKGITCRTLKDVLRSKKPSIHDYSDNSCLLNLLVRWMWWPKNANPIQDMKQPLISTWHGQILKMCLWPHTLNSTFPSYGYHQKMKVIQETKHYENDILSKIWKKKLNIPLVIRFTIFIFWSRRSDTHIWFELSRLEQGGHNNTHVW